MKRIFPIIFFIGISQLISAQPPEGYYDSASGTSGDELKAILHDIIDDHTALSYSALWEALIDTDEDPDDPDSFILIYTQRSLPKTAEYPEWNREHVWAKSHGGFDNDPPAGTDLHHIKPSDESVNSDRGNLDFDNCSETGTQHSEATTCYYSSVAWEPGDNVKGDVARMMFYMAIRYEGDTGSEPDLELQEEIPSSGSFFGKLSTLLDWHEADPPDNFEIRRNNRIFDAYQGNRNPFIDRPMYAGYIWGGETPIPGINRTFKDFHIAVWPNPANGILFLDIAQPGIEKIELADMTGKILYETDIEQVGSGIYKLDLSGSSSGICILRISDNSGNTFHKKVILLDN